jgi:hypothetical protein
VGDSTDLDSSICDESTIFRGPSLERYLLETSQLVYTPLGHNRLTNALNDKQPAPASATIDSIEITIRGCLQVAREHGAKRVAHEPDACPFEEFFVLEP